MKPLLMLTLLWAGSALAADDLTGTWNCEVETDMGSGTPTFQLKQDGSAVKGRYSGALGESDVTGTVTGSKFEISFKFDQGAVVYKGEISGNQTKGTVALGDQASGRFVCKKK